MTTTYDRMPRRIILEAATDETGTPGPDRTSDIFAYAMIFVENADDARGKVLQARQEWKSYAKTKQDLGAADRGYFHAREDSSATREFFCKAISQIPITILSLDYDKTKLHMAVPQVQGPKDLYHRALNAVVTSVTHVYCHELRVYLAEHQQFLRPTHRDEIDNHVALALAQIYVGEPSSPSVCPAIIPQVVRHEQEPLLDIADYCLWAIQRSKKPAPRRNRELPEHYLKAAGIKLKDREDHGFYGLDLYYVIRDHLFEKPEIYEWGNFLERRFQNLGDGPLLEEVEHSILAVPEAVISGLPVASCGRYEKLKEYVNRGLDHLSCTELSDFSVHLFLLLDTVPLLPKIGQTQYETMKRSLAGCIMCMWLFKDWRKHDAAKR